MKKIQFLSTILCLSISISLHAQVYSETFDGNSLPIGWLDYSEVGFDFVNNYDGSVSLFKQSEGDEIIMLASPELDLSLYSYMEIDFNGSSLAFGSDARPFLHIGILETPEDFNSFRSIYELKAENSNFETLRIDLGAYTQTSNITFKMVGERSQIIYLDNFNLYDDPVQADFPIAVQDISVEPATDGSTDLAFTWVNPGFEADGDVLTDLAHISVRSDGSEVIRFEDPIIGELQTFTGTLPSSGFYSFEIVPVNEAGNGHPVTTPKVWAGLDLPGAVTDLSIIQSANNATLSWSHPTEGSNLGFFDGILESYIITRSDGKEFTIPGSETSFEDILDTEGSINYTIVPTNSSGDGDLSQTEGIFYVTEEHLYYEDFNYDIVKALGEDSDFAYDWTVQTNGTNSSWEWFPTNFIGQNEGELSWIWTGSGNANDEVRAVSPVINTTGYDALSLNFNYYFEDAGAQDYSVIVQTSSDGGNTWTDADEIVISDFVQGAYTKTIANADVGSDNFQFALNRKGPANQNPFMRIDNIRLRYQPGVDVRALDIDFSEEIQPGDVIDFTSIFDNNSSTVVSGTASLILIERFSSIPTQVFEYIVDIDDMPIGETLEDTFESWTAIEGEYIIELTLSNADDVTLENNTISKNLNVFRMQERELIVIEEFSGTWCSACPGAALGVEDLYLEGYNVAAITYHRGDDYETGIVESKMEKYNILGFPSVVFDGVTKVEGGDQSNSIVETYRPVTESRQAALSPVHIELEYAEFTDPGATDPKQYFVRGNVISETPMNNPNLELIAVVTESHIEEEWQGLEFLDYLQRDYTSQLIDLSSGTGAFDLSMAFITADINPNNADVILFVQNLDNDQIYNATTRRLVDNLNSVKEIEIPFSADIYPNPGHDQIRVKLNDHDFTKYRIVNLQGQIIETDRILGDQFEVDVNNYKPGMYIIELSNSNQYAKSKFVKQ